MEFYEFRAMNTQIVLAAESNPQELAPAFEATRAYIAAGEQQFTRFQETSELSALNRAAGTWFNCSPEMFALLQDAYALYQQTDGIFNPAILGALERAGYDASLEMVRARSGGARTPLLEAHAENFGAIAFQTAARAVWLPPQTRIDLGGIAKGWIAERAAQRLAAYSDACAVNAGGDLFTIGLPRDETTWEIEIEDPYDAQLTLSILRVPPGAVATSSITKRTWRNGARELHHLIDPRTGAPAQTDWLSVTVVAPHATTAEVFAKALLIAGPDHAPQIAAAHTGVEFIAIDRSKKLWGSPHAQELLHERMESI